MKTHLREIQSHCRQLNRRHVLLACGLALADWAITWGLVAAWNTLIDPIQEQTAAILLILSVPVVAGLYIWGYRQNRDLFHLDLRRMARRIENSHTQLNDILVTAAHLEERGTNTPNPLERHVLDVTARQLGEIDWKYASTHWLEDTRAVIAVIITALLMSTAVATTDPMGKAAYFIRDWISETATGLVLDDFPAEVPAGSDLTVDLGITRWEQAARIHWRDTRGSHTEPVVVDATGKGSFTFYALEGDLAFNITTPSLKSGWQQIDVYQPARLDSVDIEIRPPAYTGLDSIRLDQLEDLKVPEGSSITFDLVSEAAEDVSLIQQEAVYPLKPETENRFGIVFWPQDPGPYRFLLNDARQREEKSSVHELEIVPDRPPTVEILEPTRDSVLAPDQEFLLHVYSADDYGLSDARVHLKLSNSDETLLGLPLVDNPESAAPEAGEPIRESEIRVGVSLEQLGAADGEFLALHVEVADNREPEANRTRSDLLFIEIRTPIPPEERDGMPMEQKEINLRELIDEQKRILRETYRLELLPAAEQVNRIPELISSLSALGVEINRVFAEIRPDLESAGRDDLIGLFDQSMEDNLQAIADLEAGQPQASFTPQSSSVSALLKLENAFRQNTISKNPSEGSGQGQSQGDPSEEQQEGEQPPQDLDKLLEAKESLEGMIAGQNQLNAKYDQAARSDWSEEAAREDAADQRALVEQFRELEDSLSGIPESGGARSLLNSARGHMSEAALEADQPDAAGSLRSGLRARESMRRAAAELDAMIANASGQQLASAAQAAAQLARQQAQEATASANAASGSPSSGELASMEARQRALNDRYKELLEAMEQQARESAELSPEASQALMEAAGQARSQSTGSDMERAANALLYGQPGMASPLQSSAADQLAALSQALSGAREQLGNNPMARARALNRDLMSALEELASYAREPEAAPQNRVPELRGDWSKRMEELAEISGDPRFGQLSGQLGRANPGAAPEEIAEARRILQEGARLLREFLFNEATASGLQINREAAPPPDAYRRMVEEYFRRLANEPSETP